MVAVLRHETDDRGPPRGLSTPLPGRNAAGPPGAHLNRRVLLLTGRPTAARSAVDWVAQHQEGCEVIVPPLVAAAADLARLAHPPFRPADADAAATTAGLGATAPLEAACLALLHDAPLIVAGTEIFPDLVPLSAWSMNVPARPTDGLLVRHLAIAARVRGAVAVGAPAALEAIRAGDLKGLEAIARARRRAARADGPARFRRIAKTSAGLRPFAIYLDLVPLTLAEGGQAHRAWIASLEPAAALRLLDLAVALFI